MLGFLRALIEPRLPASRYLEKSKSGHRLKYLRKLQARGVLKQVFDFLMSVGDVGRHHLFRFFRQPFPDGIDHAFGHFVVGMGNRVPVSSFAGNIELTHTDKIIGPNGVGNTVNMMYVDGSNDLIIGDSLKIGNL